MQPDVLFLMETKLTEDRMTGIKGVLGFSHGLFVRRLGLGAV